MTQKQEDGYLERLTRAFLTLDAEKHVSTKEFTDAVAAIMPIFDYLGAGHTPSQVSVYAGNCGVDTLDFPHKPAVSTLINGQVCGLMTNRDCVLLCQGGDDRKGKHTPCRAPNVPQDAMPCARDVLQPADDANTWALCRTTRWSRSRTASQRCQTWLLLIRRCAWCFCVVCSRLSGWQGVERHRGDATIKMWDMHIRWITVSGAGVQTNTVTRKNSGARNLHRLVSAVSFIATLLQNVVKDPSATLRQARQPSCNTLLPLASCLSASLVAQQCHTMPRCPCMNQWRRP